MIEHIVLFRWTPEATSERIAAGMEALRGLRHSIAGITALACGADFSGRAQGYTHVLVIRFSDRASFDAYGPSSAHRAVVETHLKPILQDVIDFDFEVTP